MSNFIFDFNESYKDRFVIGNTSNCSLNYTPESYYKTISDIEDEGSGLLNINCDSDESLNIFNNFIKQYYPSIYVIELNVNSISLIIDETVLEIRVEDREPDEESDEEPVEESEEEPVEESEEEPEITKCLYNCKCINCMTEEKEKNETICLCDCKCINCNSNS